MSENQQIVVGSLTRDPELRYTSGGFAVCSFAVAWNSRKRDESGNWVDGDSSFFDCTAWRDLGEHVAASLSKGDRVIVVGRNQQRSYEDRDGNKRTAWDIQVDAVGPELRFATAVVEKVTRDKPAEQNSAPVYDNEEPF